MSMDKDTIKGKMKDVGGRMKRQAGEWTGDKEMQKEGSKDQIEGKAQKTFGNVKDAARDAKRDLESDKKKDEAA